MTVSTTSNRIAYAGNGSTTVFPFSFSVPANVATAAADIQVYFTDTFGNITLLASTAYTLVFNAPTTNNPTPVGGSVTYNPGGIPIAIGTTLTIVRAVQSVQSTSFTNQTAFFQQVIETSLDNAIMAVQDAAGSVANRAIVVPPTDPIPNPLPTATARANQIMGFDGTGNPTVLGVLPTGGSISSAMAPVCAAATLALARSNMGLGNVAVEAIGPGLVDDGAGNLIVNNAVTILNPPGTTITMTKANHGQFFINQRFSGSVIVLTATTTYFNGFNFTVYHDAIGTLNPIQIQINAGDSFFGLPTGQAFSLNAGATVRISTDGAGHWFITYLGKSPSYATVDNYSLSATVASGALTISVLDSAGNTPSVTNPVVVGSSNGIGGFTEFVLTGSAQITVPLNATLGTQNNIGARIWVGIFGSTLGVYVSVAQSSAGVPTSILAWDETAQVTPTQITSASNSPQTWYAASLIGSPIGLRVLGFVEITEPTAGNWSVAPTLVGIYAPGTRKPGDIVQNVVALNTTLDTTSSATFVVLSHNEISVQLQSKANVVYIEADAPATTNASNQALLQLSRGTTPNTNLIGNKIGANSTADITAGLFAYDMPNTIGTTVYAIQGQIAGGSTLSAPAGGGTTGMRIQEIYV